jgi:hypothetical protein
MSAVSLLAPRLCGESSHRIAPIVHSPIGSKVSLFHRMDDKSKYFSHRSRLFAFALLVLSVGTYAQNHTTSERPWIGLEGVTEIIRKLSAKDATPLSRESVEDVTGTKLVAPDTNYPTEVLEQLKRIGVPPPEKPGYIKGGVLISKDMSLHIQLARPSLLLEFRPYGYLMPKAVANDSLKKLLPKIDAYNAKAFKNNCLKKNAVFDVLHSNGWIFSKTEFTKERDAVTGNFQFVSPNQSLAVTVTVEQNCFEELIFGSPE